MQSDAVFQVDIVFSMLLRKCTETSVFIADEAKRTVCVMMENVSPVIIMMTMIMSNAVVGFVIIVTIG